MSTLKSLQAATCLADLAVILGYRAKALSYIVYVLPEAQKYTKFNLPKKSGGVREINAPTEPLKILQRRLANVLYACRDHIDAEGGRQPLSHGFRRHYSIITNARQHHRRRYVLNVDIQDFFPSFNFGRVRGFFIKNRDFALNEKVATIIAQIACHENMLPQGSPCSPIIADMLAHLLDVRLAGLARQNRVTYSRYADDLTFSTNQKEFPAALAERDGAADTNWVLGDSLTSTIKSTGFVINGDKTRMQCKAGRQLVTGLTVNAKVNIRPEYYRLARAMCHSLFERGEYYLPTTIISTKPRTNGALPTPEAISGLGPIEGILSHIHHVKNIIDGRDKLEKKKHTTAVRKLYAKLLFYRYFIALKRPLIVCEGRTDNVYLKYAIRKLTALQPKLGAWNGTVFNSTVSFLSYINQAHKLLELDGGTGDLKFFLLRYKRTFESFKHRPLTYPAIVLIDNDKGANEIVNVVRETFKVSIEVKSPQKFYHLSHNLYLVKTPEGADSSRMSCIEDFFDPSLLATELDGKKFNPAKIHAAEGEYGKTVFADKVVRPNADKIDFTNFAPLLERIVAVIDDYDKARLGSKTRTSN